MNSPRALESPAARAAASPKEELNRKRRTRGSPAINRRNDARAPNWEGSTMNTNSKSSVTLDFSAEISKVTDDFEFVFIVEPSQFGALASLRRLMAGEPRVRLFRFNSSFGEAAALAAGLSRARGEFIFTLASYYQVRPETFRQVYELLNQNKDVVVTRRYPRIDSNFGRFPSFVFHWIASRLSGIAFHDGSCGFRGIRRESARELTVYGDLHPFLPALANRQGDRFEELKALQHPLNTRAGVRGPGAYASRLLALFTLFFLMKFIN